MSEGNRLPPPKMNCLSPIKDVEGSVGKQHAIVLMGASEKRVPNHLRCFRKSQTITKSNNTQLSSHIPAKAVRLSFAGSRLSLNNFCLFLAWEQCCFREQRHVPGALQSKTLAALNAPVACNVRTTDPTEDRFILWVSKCFSRTGLPVQAFAIFPGLHFATHFFHSSAASCFS